ncbi:MAG: hypothetical protein ACE5LU_09120 [Anaerolineae bacterium]
MRLHPRSVRIVGGLTLIVLLSLAFNRPVLSPVLSWVEGPVEGSQATPEPVIDVAPVYLPAIARNYPNLLPPPLDAKREGWLRKWKESQSPDYCLEASGTPYYLERDAGDAGWLAAIAETDTVSELELEVHIDEKVAVTGTVEYFDPACEFPRLNAHKLEVIETTPDGHSGP